jgi:hypothetical protein
MNGRWDAAKKVLCTSSKMPFFIDLSHRNLYKLWRIRRKWCDYILSVIPWIEGEMLRRRFYVLPVKFPPFLTECNQIFTNCGACAGCDVFTFSKRSHKYKARCCEEGTSYIRKLSFFIDWSLPLVHLYTYHLLRFCHNWYKFRFNRSIRKGTLLFVQSTLFAVSRLLFKGSLWNSKPITFCAYATIGVNLVAIGQ